jgi:hypothetical protein
MSSTEAQKAANRKYYEHHKEEEKARSSKWRSENKDWYDAWALKNKDKRAANARKREYNLPPEVYDAKLKAQDGRCEICGVVMTRPDVDHDHACCSGRSSCGQCVRGILCHKCNTIIGLANDSIELLGSSIQYLKGYSNASRQQNQNQQ